DFYRGMIGGLLVSHQLLKACRIEDKSLAELISLAAARASEQYLNLKNSEEFFFPDVIESE
ncbi:MAG: hypothetical protein ACRD9R_08090, partial [Pyrinomonadaceae bacterium]